MVGSKDLEPSNAPFFPNVFFNNQFRAKPQHLPSTTNLSDMVAVVTGGNTGLGFEASRQLLSFKLSHLILAVRSPEKGEAAASELLTQHRKANIEVWQLDMSSYDSIQAFARRVQDKLSRLDIVILNAGVRKLSFDTVRGTGHEETIQVNYLSTALLAILLLPILKSKSPAGGPSRLTIAGAALSLAAKFPTKNKDPLLPSFDDAKTFTGIDRYNTSKLLVQMFLWKLVDYVSADDVVVNVADPGFVKGTGLTRDAKGGAKIRPFSSFLYTPDGKAVTERLWQETLSELNFAGVEGILDSLKWT
ncbi:hypothetical protein DL768_008383 [Monosporascus sp. mg162]|nr:hypothetical protein DL768_008383 [Monosporascus sp. mg162]